MDSSTHRRTGSRSPLPPKPPASPPASSSSTHSQRNQSPFSESSESSQATISSAGRRPVYTQQTGQYNINTSIPNFSRPSNHSNEGTIRKTSPFPPSIELQRHRPRQHSQGFFEPSLPSASLTDHNHMGALSASQIAAQAAMQHHPSLQHMRKRSQTVPNPSDPLEPSNSRSVSTSTSTLHVPTANASPHPGYHNGLPGGNKLAATTAANIAFPRTVSPNPPVEPVAEKEPKPKSEKSKMKLFSKPKHIGIYRDKDAGSRERPPYSPSKISFTRPSGLSTMVNASSTSLVDTLNTSGAPSLYASANSSTTALGQPERPGTADREKSHKHHFLTRQKLKLKDKEERHLALSSASSNSKPVDPNAPQSLYSFAPSSPGPSTTSFAKSMSGLDLRHGGKALRDKRKEEKAALAVSFEPPPPRDSEDGHSRSLDWPVGPSSSSIMSAPFLTSPAIQAAPSIMTPTSSGVDFLTSTSLQGFGINNMTPDDVWDFLKAKLLIIFSGEDVRIAVEDLNRLVLVYVQRCIQKANPFTIIEDLRDLFDTGFRSLNQALRNPPSPPHATPTNQPQDQLIPLLVDMWLFVFGTVLPFMQAVFLPLDLEFKGHGSLMTSQEAIDFWGSTRSIKTFDAETPTSPSETVPQHPFGEDFSTRRLLLLSFRDTIILPRHTALKTTFSRLSLESLSLDSSSNVLGSNVDIPTSPTSRPSTATSTSLDPHLASFNSQGSTLLGSTSPSTILPSSNSVSHHRSRAQSNLSQSSNPSNHIYPLPSTTPQSLDASKKITETVARTLQLLSILAGLQSGDESQMAIESLGRELKHNWLGRGRTGRNRRGWVGSRVKAGHMYASSVVGQGNGQMPKWGTVGGML
ncbi:MAG: hypothetical protein M1834_002902 [Cirrosporium novae-zelandiae]|nr:MAG: hypothetical protein M1834_002902 [Cirrosporium novae-zelandiae]